MTFEEIGHIDVSGVNKIHHIVFQDENTFWVNDGSECLRQTDMQGQILHTIKTASNGDGIHTFTEHENRNGDVIVTSNGNKKVVVVMDRSGRYRFSYTGNPGNSIANPWGVVTDILKNILICDSDNKRIQIINEDGMFLAYINVPNAYGFLSAVDVDDMHYVWVGFSSSGTIRKFRYLQE
ncbi:tripartite motif-containing protein 2-like [Saccostrea cucullata]|uniref:tripartite motif-containing protein 2-like n=1 Tax=Saccostrea cuccullata TaxID=36930 RepID=UPI002ED07A5B